MFFVKYLSDTFDENVKELEKEYSGIRLERQIANLLVNRLNYVMIKNINKNKYLIKFIVIILLKITLY